MKFEDYYKEFCEVFGHPLWCLPMFGLCFLLMVEVMHTNYHADANSDAHGFCGRQEWVKDLKRFKENNAY